MRAQYHFRPSERGLLAWDVRRLVMLTQDLPVNSVSLVDIRELDRNYWYGQTTDNPTCRSIVEHCRLMLECDFAFPVILDSEGRVMDGMHRICRALLDGIDAVDAVQFPVDPEPDYVGRTPDELPYDD